MSNGQCLMSHMLCSAMKREVRGGKCEETWAHPWREATKDDFFLKMEKNKTLESWFERQCWRQLGGPRGREESTTSHNFMGRLGVQGKQLHIIFDLSVCGREPGPDCPVRDMYGGEMESIEVFFPGELGPSSKTRPLIIHPPATAPSHRTRQVWGRD
jgi:hypothetical protein